MAKPRTKRRLLVLFVVFGYSLLVIAEVLPNPLPAAWGWVTAQRPLADGLAWQDRLGARPASATVAGEAVAVAAGAQAHLWKRRSGEPVGGGEAAPWSADWLVVAGTGEDAVVISRPDGGAGYQVREAATGRVRHVDEEAVAVWAFQDGWLDLRCDRRRACQVRRYQPGQLEPVWRTDLPGQRSGMRGADPELAAARVPADGRIDQGVVGPGPMPRMLGFPVTRGGRDVVVVVDTGSGQIRQELTPDRDERIIVVGDRVIRSVMARHHDVCVSAVSGHDPVTGGPVWGPVPYHLWGNGGVGCEQRTPPVASGAALIAVSPEGREVVLDAYDGRVLWTGELGERVVGLSPELAVVRAADEETTVYGVRLGGDGQRWWERRIAPDADVLVADCGVVVADRDPSRVFVWEPETGETRLSVSTSATVLACAPDGLVIAAGRSIGFAPFDADDPDADDPR